jgi:hypothetical protein
MATLDSEPYPMSEDDSTRPETPRPSTQSLATEEQPAERQPEEFHDGESMYSILYQDRVLTP